MPLAIKRASKLQSKARIALIGPSGSGKTFSSLVLAREFAQGGKVLVVDTEHRSASLYADKFDFDVIELQSFAPKLLIEAMDLAEAHDYQVVVIDSLSAFWAGRDGVLEYKDQVTSRSRTGDSYGAGWREASPVHNAMVERMLTLSEHRHLIVTLRSKMAYVQEVDEKTGKTRIRKVGMQPIQRDNIEYEFSIVGDLDLDNVLVITKSRCEVLNKAVIPTPGPELARDILAWLTDGAPMPEVPQATPPRANGHPPALQSRNKPTRAPESQPGHPSISALRSLFRRKKELGISDEALKEKLDGYGVENTKDLSPEQYQAVCDWIEAQANVPDGLVPGSDEAWAALEERSRAVGWTGLQWQGAREHLGYADVLAEIVALEPDPTQPELI